MAEDFTPRSYQVELMKIGTKQDSIIFLPTGAGKTFIALLVLKQLSASLQQSYSDGGKISVILVNSVALVSQHSKYIEDHTDLRVGSYTGDMNLDFWPRDKWYEEYDKYQVFVMTSQILVNNVTSHYIDLNKVNLLILDECHSGVNDQPMRQLMKTFVDLDQPPRVLGLTATLLNHNCKPASVVAEVKALEITYHSQVATVDGLQQVIGFSTNPNEKFKDCRKHVLTSQEQKAISILNKVIDVVKQVVVETKPKTLGLTTLNQEMSYKKILNAIKDVIFHIETLGIFGAVKTIIAHVIQFERFKTYCQDAHKLIIFNYIITNLLYVKELLQLLMKDHDIKGRIFNFSSHKVLQLIQIFREYPSRSKQALCGIVFTKRRFTARIIYHILDDLGRNVAEFSHIKPNYMVGYNSNPTNETQEGLFVKKKNKQVLGSFSRKEINVLVASNVLEEGVDVPTCTLVVKYDKPEDYRSYIQSKGRARHKESLYYIVVEDENLDSFTNKYREFQIVEQTLNDIKMSSDSDEEMCTPPDITEKAQMATDNLLPTKSRQRYLDVYRKFMEWRLENNVKSFSENVLLAYFEELSNKMKPSSLWAKYSMLRTTLNINHDNINIAGYPKLIALLKRKSDGFKSKKSKTFNNKQINEFLENAPDSKYLLMKYLIGKNKERSQPLQEDIEKMYHEDEIPPYYVAGPGSAQVTMASAISLLCQYCTSLPSDVYTTYAPEWYIKKRKSEEETLLRVVILLPIICPLRDTIEGAWMKSTKSAKRAAALKACTLLHKAGELDDHLLPKKIKVLEDDVRFLFTHYPKEKDPSAGNSKTRRLHELLVPRCLQGQIKSEASYLHIIELTPLFKKPTDISDSTIYDAYTSPLCFGFMTPEPLPVLCDFPIYVKQGTINVTLTINHRKISLSGAELEDIRNFHFQIFHGVLEILRPFLVFDGSSQAHMMLLVPIDKASGTIDFLVMRKHKEIKTVTEVTENEKVILDVTQDRFLKKIVSPWYKQGSFTYIVTKVCLGKNAYTPFPSDGFNDFKDYFVKRHNQTILRPDLPLLLVKGLTRRLNFLKPVGKESKRKRDQVYEDMTEYMVPELIVRQDFPSALWIQARFLPTILGRISFILNLDELRSKIAREAGLGKEIVPVQPPLQLDEHLLTYVPYIEDETEVDISVSKESASSCPPRTLYKTDFAKKTLEAEFPWKDIQEPKDLDRCLDVSLSDIELYEAFIHQKLTPVDSALNRREHQLAVTSYNNFVPKSIRLLEKSSVETGPTLRELYRAMTTAKANDIVNLERLETLGDSFLKLIASVYISLRFPHYNEGRATDLKGRMVSNRNLYYLALKKNLAGIIKYQELSPKDQWLPPAFTVPGLILDRIKKKVLSINALFDLNISNTEQVSGVLQDSAENMLNLVRVPDENEEDSYNSKASFLNCQYIGDKFVADAVESLLGVYFETCGFIGAVKFVEWLRIIPPQDNIQRLLKQAPPDPVLNKDSTLTDIEFHLPFGDRLEQIIGYKFKNRAYLLQALTHASYVPNRITLSYEKLEFLGDAVLDFLITCHIYESCGNLNPGELTDLRSALVNNNTFASLVVRYGLHKYLLMINSLLQRHIDKFAEFLAHKNYEIDDEVLILLQEDELNLSEYVDVPKVLGDIFEAIAGAIYLDSGKDLNAVWKVFYKLMFKEIELFSKQVPKNIIRKLFEYPGAAPKFGATQITTNSKTLIPLQFELNGITKVVHGCGTNKTMARKAAAKLALSFLET